jgi:GTPase
MPPQVVIAGRPNVGKSTLFNRLVGKRIALVDDTPGVTRDRREGSAQLFDLEFTIVDTAGLEDISDQSLTHRMRQQTDAAIAQADMVLFMIDARAGVTPLDKFFARFLRQQNTPVRLIANKAEGLAAQATAMECYELGFEDPIMISAEHGEGLADLYSALVSVIGHTDEQPQDIVPPTPELLEGEEAPAKPLGPMQLAIVGRPNAGKSTLINRLLGEDRLVTGPEAGITRDSIAVDWEWQGRAVKLIDTAGIRKRARVVEKLEKLSVADAKRAIDFAEVVILLLDGTLGLEAQDLRIASMVLEEGRALLIGLNKWDAVEDQGGMFRGITAALEEGLAQVKGLSMIPISGHTGKNLDVLLKAAFDLRDLWSTRISTGRLNRWFEAAVERTPPPAPGGKRIKLRYITQTTSRPPTFVIWGNRTDECPVSYQRYLINGLREEIGFKGVPIRIIFRNSKNPYEDESGGRRKPGGDGKGNARKPARKPNA